MKKNKQEEDNSDKEAKSETEISHLKSLLLNYENIFNNASDAIFIMHRGKFSDCNLRAESLIGLPKNKIIGKGPADFSPEYQPGNIKSKDRLIQLLKEAEKGTKQTFKWTYLKSKGKEFITEVSFSKVSIDDKTNIQVIVRDITENHKANIKILEQNNEIAALNEEYVSQNDELQSKNEELLKINTENKQLLDQVLENEEKFRLLFEKSNDPVLLIEDFNFIECNYAALNLLGFTHFAEIRNISPAEISPEYQPDGKRSDEKGREMMNIALAKGYNRFEWVHKDRFNNEFYVDVALTPIPFRGKTMIYTVWHNISKLKEKEKAILISEQKFKELFNQAADGILVGVGKGEIIDANESILQLLGYSREELIGKNIGILFEKEELSDKPLRYDLVKKGDTVIRERKIVRKDGSRVYVEMNTKIISDGRMQALIRDISRRKEAEIELEKNRELLQKAESVAGLGRFVYHVESDTWESSPILNKIFGIEDYYKKDFGSWLRLIHPAFQVEMKEYFITNILKNREPFNKVYKIVRHHDQQERWVLGMAEMECDANNNPVVIFGTIQDINDSKNSEIALKESEEKYKNIFYNSPLGIMHYDNKGIITDCNKQFVDILGSSKEKLVGLNMLKELPNKQMVESVKQSFIDGESYYEDWYTSVTGNKSTFVRVFFKTILNSNKEKIAGVCLVEDITDRHKSRQLLKENEEKFRRLFERANDSIFLMKDDIFIDCNQKTLEMFGCQRDEIIGKPPYLFSPEYQPDGKLSKKKALEKIKAALKGSVNTFEWVHSKLDKTTFDAEVSLNSFKLGEDIFIQAIVRDVTERKKFVEKLQVSEDKFSKIFDFTPDAIILTDIKTGKIFDINEGCTQITGFTKAESIGKSTIELNIWLTITDWERYVELLKQGSVRNFEVDVRVKSGKIITGLISADIIQINNNPYVLAIMRNISDRKEAEKRVKLSEEKFRNIFNSSSDLIAITKQDGTIITVNQTVLENSGLPIERIVGQKIYTIISEDFSKKTEERTKLLNEGKELPIIEIEARNKNNEIVPLEVISKLINYENEKAILIVARNIKERKDLEKRLINAIIETEEKERQRLAGDLHDEVGPLLSSMKMYINILSSNKEEAKGKYIIEQLNLLVEESIHNIREVSGALNPYLLNRYGLKTAVESFFDKSKSLMGVQFVTNIENKRFPINIEATYYRIIKELYNNTIKHAEATNVVIELNYDTDLLNLKYSDNGVGFVFEESTSEKKKGMGVQNIINRVKMINGKYTVSTDKKNGFHFELTTKCPIIENE
jgi:PAS domain S-box-containing protein